MSLKECIVKCEVFCSRVSVSYSVEKVEVFLCGMKVS